MLIDNNLNQTSAYTPLNDDNNLTYNAHSYSQVGGYDIGYLRNEGSGVIWTLIFDLGQRRFYMRSSSGISHNLLSVPDTIQVTQVTFTFDSNGNVVWAYSYIDNITSRSYIYLGSFTPKANKPVVNIRIINNSTSPTLTLDVVRNIGGNRILPSILLFYTPADSSNMIVRQNTDNFTVERQVAELKDNEFIVKSGMTIGRRVKVTTREIVGRTVYKTFLTAQGGLLLDSTGRPLWVSHIQRT